LTSVKEVDLSHGFEKTKELKRGDENKENEGGGGIAGEGGAGCKKSVSFKLPTSPAPRGIVISPFKDETNNPGLSRRGGMCPGGTADQTNLVGHFWKTIQLSFRLWVMVLLGVTGLVLQWASLVLLIIIIIIFVFLISGCQTAP